MKIQRRIKILKVNNQENAPHSSLVINIFHRWLQSFHKIFTSNKN